MKNLSKLLSQHCYEILHELTHNHVDFYIMTPLQNVYFNPTLPKDIIDTLSPITMFIISGFTLESLQLDRDGITFEAGFGKQNIASVISIDYKNILQISTRLNDAEVTLFINIFSLDNVVGNEDKESDEESLINSSRNAILSNPKNKLDKGKT